MHNAHRRFRPAVVVAASLALLAALVLPVSAAGAVTSGAVGLGKSTSITFSATLDAGYKDEIAYGRHQYGVTVLTGKTTVRGESVDIERISVYEYTNGSGPITGFLTLTWPDGSRLSMRVGGQTEQTDAGAKIFATLRVFGAKGAWRGYTGMGLMQGIRKGPIGTPVEYEFSIDLQKG